MLQQKLNTLFWNKILGDVLKIYMYMFGALRSSLLCDHMKITASIHFYLNVHSESV